MLVTDVIRKETAFLGGEGVYMSQCSGISTGSALITPASGQGTVPDTMQDKLPICYTIALLPGVETALANLNTIPKPSLADWCLLDMLE